MGMIKDWIKRRNTLKEGVKQAYYGGSKAALEQYRVNAKQDVTDRKNTEQEQWKSVKEQASKTKALEAGAEYERLQDRETAAGSRGSYSSTLDNLGENSEAVLQKRAAELASKPTIGQATDAALQAQAKNAQDQLAQKIGMQNRQARGLAGSMGEGGALAMQQAMASAGAGAADALAMNQTQQNQLAGDMRYKAALAQNQQDVDTSNLNAGTRLAAQQQQLAGRAGLMASDIGVANASGNRHQNMLGAANNMTTGMYGAASGQLANAQNQLANIEGISLAAEREKNQKDYENAVAHNPLGTFISTVFDPWDLRGSGSKGFATGG